MIDTHQHLLYPKQFNYEWAADFPALQGAFHLEDYWTAAESCDIEGTLFMEVDVDAKQSGDEARFFCECAAEPANRILGVIASARPEDAGFDAYLDSIAHSKLKGIRRVLHTQPDALSQSPRFKENIASLAKRGLSFDVCVQQGQLAIALELAQACPDVRFILDHCGVPSIAEHTTTDCESWQQWQSGIRAIAAQPNVACKFSGITAYAQPEQRSVEGLRPYLTEILEAFGTSRIVWGGDWPVCNLADGLPSWCQLTNSLLADLSEDEQTQILRNNARTLYTL
jgi:predicted TIM-barrel fold metal-dependent hydrolase